MKLKFTSLRTPLSLAAVLATAAACSTTPAPNAQVETVRSSLQQAQTDPQAQGLAGAELRLATEALAAADTAVDHLAYVAQQRVTLLQKAAGRRAAEAATRDVLLVVDSSASHGLVDSKIVPASKLHG